MNKYKMDIEISNCKEPINKKQMSIVSLENLDKVIDILSKTLKYSKGGTIISERGSANIISAEEFNNTEEIIIRITKS